MEERRNNYRYKVCEKERCIIYYKPLKSGLFRKPLIAITLNISASGILFTAPQIYPLNTVFLIKLALPGHKKMLKLKGKIVRIDTAQNQKSNKIALSYADISKSDRTIIDTFCQNIKSDTESKSEDDRYQIYI